MRKYNPLRISVLLGLLVAVASISHANEMDEEDTDTGDLYAYGDSYAQPETFAYEDSHVSGSRDIASNENGPGEDHAFHRPQGPCAKIGLSDEQKSKIKTETYKFKEAAIDMKAQVARALLKYRKIMESPDSDYKSAKSASQELADSQTKLIAAKRALKAQIAFQILKPEQRAPAMACENHRRFWLKSRKSHQRPHDDWG